MFLTIMQKNQFLLEATVKSILQNIQLEMKGNIIKGIDNNYPLMVKRELKKLVEPSQYDKVSKMLILFVSGPNCLDAALEKYLNAYFLKHKMTQDEKIRVLESISISSKVTSTHQNDTVWVISEDDTELNYQKYYRDPAAKVIGKAVLTWWENKKRKTSTNPAQPSRSTLTPSCTTSETETK